MVDWFMIKERITKNKRSNKVYNYKKIVKRNSVFNS